MADVAPFGVEVVSDLGARGFPGACCRSLEVARGDYVVLLADDVVVTDAWLNQLVALAKSDPAIGMTVPMSNTALPHLYVEPGYADEEGLRRFAGHWRESHRGQWFSPALAPSAFRRRAP